MSQYPASKLITPPSDEEVHPYRQAWQSVIIETALLILVTVALFVSVNFVGLSIPQALRWPANVTLALLPALLWLIFSYWRERYAQEPRSGLLITCVTGALVANAIGLPLLNDFVQPERWLSLQSTVNRIIGYTVTVGIVQELLKYLIVRYIAWPDSFRERNDAVAFGAASAIGYATVVNLAYVLSTDAAVDVVAARILSVTTLHIVGSVIVGYGLAQLLFSRVTVLLLPLMLLIAALLPGIATPLRSGLINAPLLVDGAATRPLFGLAFTILAFVVPMLGMYFLYRVADQRDKSRESSTEA